MEYNIYKTKYPKETGRYIIAFAINKNEGKMYNSFGIYQGNLKDWYEVVFDGTEEEMLNYIIQLKKNKSADKIEVYKEMYDIKKYEF